MLFTKNQHAKDLEKALKNAKSEISDLEESIKQVRWDCEHELKEKELKNKYFKDEEIKKVQDAQIKAEKRTAVLESENELYKKLVDTNAEIINIKELVTKLIEKLPQVDLKNITVYTHDTSSK
jgi:arginine/lysine/ornithine decarboxylase